MGGEGLWELAWAAWPCSWHGWSRGFDCSAARRAGGGTPRPSQALPPPAQRTHAAPHSSNPPGRPPRARPGAPLACAQTPSPTSPPRHRPARPRRPCRPAPSVQDPLFHPCIGRQMPPPTPADGLGACARGAAVWVQAPSAPDVWAPATLAAAPGEGETVAVVLEGEAEVGGVRGGGNWDARPVRCGAQRTAARRRHTPSSLAGGCEMRRGMGTGGRDDVLHPRSPPPPPPPTPSPMPSPSQPTTVPASCVAPANPASLDGAHDVTALTFLNEAAVLHGLRQRHARDEVRVGGRVRCCWLLADAPAPTRPTFPSSHP